MREVSLTKVTEAIKELSMDANYNLGEDVYQRIKDSIQTEESDVAKEILKQILQNADIAKKDLIGICQDTGFSVIFIELGQEVYFKDGDFMDAINEGVRQGYTEGYLRKSIVSDPLRRVNTKDNTPAVVHLDIVPGDKIKIIMAPKGGGSENMSEVRMLKPADGAEGVKDFVVDKVSRSGGNPCPPIIVGVGIGGTFEKCAFLAKKALLRNIGERNPDTFYADMEVELLERVNKLGVGPQGLGGTTTALEVFVEAFPCHIASLPAAVNLNCHAARHKSIII